MLKGLQLSPQFDEWFASIPARMYLNRNLNGTDRDVYGAIKICLRAKSGTIEVGQSEIGQFLDLSARQVRRSVQRLLMAKEIMATAQRGAPSMYTITEPPATTKQQPGAAETEKSFIKPAAPVMCPQCRKIRRALLKIGICRSCNTERKMDRIAERAAERVYDRREEQAKPAKIDRAA